MIRLYVYKCVVDDGGAPCVERGLLSLCICKPAIRSTARVGDLIFAFGGNGESPVNRLVYIAEVTQKLTDGEYFQLAEFSGRADCIYNRSRDGRFRVRASARFHADHTYLERDLGSGPHYRRANSLLSDNFRYFGRKGTDEWKAEASFLARLIDSLQQGHRVRHTPALRDELLALKRLVWGKYNKRVLGAPLHRRARSCERKDVQALIRARRTRAC
jgi:hypothetical protein